MALALGVDCKSSIVVQSSIAAIRSAICVSLTVTLISVRRLALVALGIAWAVEFSQLWHPPWLDAIRATTPGHLVLGSAFGGIDLLAYAVGIVIVAGIDWVHT